MSSVCVCLCLCLCMGGSGGVCEDDLLPKLMFVVDFSIGCS